MRSSLQVRPAAVLVSLHLGALGALGCGGRMSDKLASANGSASNQSTNPASAPRVEVSGFDKVDLLLVIDNSLAMADKQTVLTASMPRLLRRLTNPNCVNEDGSAVLEGPMPTVPCPGGFHREFAPLSDVHIGIVTSSLGDFGGDTCPEEGVQNRSMNDHAWLLGALPRAKLGGGPFLAWADSGQASYEQQFAYQMDRLEASMFAASELGCGNEMPLEAMYRFLVDPQPASDVISLNQAANQRSGVDAKILSMRQAFLRPDSLVVVLILSDENDCSMRDDTYSWVAMTASGGLRMWRGSSVCASNPNDPCCYSCMLDGANWGVSQACLQKDTSCRQGDSAARLSRYDDDINVRCRQMKQRFGYDYLFPPSRYVNALTLPELCPNQTYGDLDCNCIEAKSKGLPCDPRSDSKVKNPLFENQNPSAALTGPLRPDAQGVFLTAVVGVPWQDLAVDYQAYPLRLRTASELDWDLFAPRLDEDYGVAQLKDPFMRESMDPRSGRHPITGELIAGPEASRWANDINGHEWLPSARDVQYACIYSLEAMGPSGTDASHRCDIDLACGAQNDTDSYRICERQFDGCRCTMTPSDATEVSPLDPMVSYSPLCQSTSGAYGNTQYFAGAYPGLRELQVLRGFHEVHAGNKSIVGSICPKNANITASGDPEFGYNPTMDLLVDELREKLRKE